MRDTLFVNRDLCPEDLFRIITEFMSVVNDENVSPIGSPQSKKERIDDSQRCTSPPRLPVEFQQPLREVICYDQGTVDELVGHLCKLLEKSEHEVLYWSTLYEESQKELFEVKEKMRKNEKEEADYIDPEVIPNMSRRNSKQPIEGGAETPTGSRWGLFRGVLSAVVGHTQQNDSGNS
jgi:hypothetical protein